MFPTLISKRLLGDFLWYRKLYSYIHRTSSNNFGVVRVNGSNTRNYMLWLHIYPSLVICRSSLFSLPIKKEFLKQVSCLCFTCDVIATIENGGDDPGSRTALWLTQLPRVQHGCPRSDSDPTLPCELGELHNLSEHLRPYV